MRHHEVTQKLTKTVKLLNHTRSLRMTEGSLKQALILSASSGRDSTSE